MKTMINRQTPIKIIDRHCGSGKTTAMIDGFSNDNNYLVVVPYKTEIERVIKQSTKVAFVQPNEEDNDDRTKRESLRQLLSSGCNVVTSHALHELILPIVNEGLLDNYHIIIDEVPNVASNDYSLSKRSVEEFYISNGYIDVEPITDLIRPTMKWYDNRDEVKDTLNTKLIRSAEGGCLYLQSNSQFIKAMPRALLVTGLSTTIMTYKAEGSMLLPYLRKLELPFVVANDNELEDVSFKQKAAELITIESFMPNADFKFTHNEQIQRLKDGCYTTKVSKALNNLRSRQLKNVPIENVMITCAKYAWYTNGDKVANKPGPFAKNSNLWGANWLANITRGTNDFVHCSHLIYLHNKHPNPALASWLGVGTKHHSDAHALTELIQWVWRSRIRRGEPITLYFASKRMRQLFEDWLGINNH